MKQFPMECALITGCFDVLHVGHLQLIETAYKHGPVIAGLNSDSAIKKLKGNNRPINTFKDRAAMLKAMLMVDDVFEIDDTTVSDAIRTVRPAYWVKGSDYTMKTLNQDERMAAKAVGAKIIFAKLKTGRSTTRILNKLINQ